MKRYLFSIQTKQGWANNEPRTYSIKAKNANAAFLELKRLFREEYSITEHGDDNLFCIQTVLTEPIEIKTP